MKNLGLNAKIIFVLSIFVAASVVISFLGIAKLSELNRSIASVIDETVPRLILSKDIPAIVSEIKNQEKVFIIEVTPEGMEGVKGTLVDLEKKLRTEIADLRGRAILEETKKELDGASALVDEWRVVSDEIRRLSMINKNAEAAALARGKSREVFDRLDEVMGRITTRNLEALKKEEERTTELYADAKNTIILVSSLAIALGLILAFVILRSVNKAIDSVISGLNDSANQVTSAAQQIASSSEQLSQGATEQASSLEETSSAVEEMNSMVQKNAESARASSDVSQASGNSADRGKKVVEDMKRAMQEIDSANSNIMHQTNESNQKISEIVKVIAEIGNKTKVINDIVFQTKLLSFNASVEAARAGEHGKGFAVVAEEVGNLAQMSGNAAKEISSMLDSSIQKVESIVRDTRSSVEKLIAESKNKVEVGTKVAMDCGEVLEEIVSNVSQVTNMSHSIASASDEQARGISEITKAVTQLDQMTQQNAAASEETASAAEELSAQAESMQAVVQTLISTIKGGDQTSAPARAPGVSRSSNHVAQPAAKREAGRVLHMGGKSGKRSSQQAPSYQPSLKMAAGSDVIPSEDDPRFKDV